MTDRHRQEPAESLPFLRSEGVQRLRHIIQRLPTRSVVTICGPSCSGKTTLAAFLAETEACVVLPMDNFFKPIPEIPEYLPNIPAFDSPEAFDMALLTRCLAEIRKGHSVRIPVYHYYRTALGRDEHDSSVFSSNGITLLDGILSFDQCLSGLIDFAVFVDRDENARREARLRRDVEERGVNLDRAMEIYDNMTVPLFRQHGEQQRQRAHAIISNQ